MKTSLALLLFFAFQFQARAQTTQTAFDTLLLDFRNDYSKHANVYPATFYEGFTSAIPFLLNPHNPTFRQVLKEWKQKFPGDSTGSVAVKIADSIFDRMHAEFLWHGHEGELLKFLTILEKYNQKLCPCLSSREISLDSLFRFFDLRKECDATIENDFIFMNTVRRELHNIPVQERQNLQSAMANYIYQECPVFTNHVKNELLRQYDYNLSNHLYLIASDLPQKVTDLYSLKLFDSLQNIFPAFSQYKKDLDQANKQYDAGIQNVLRQETNKLEMKRVFSVIFYKKGKPSVILSQAVCEIDINDGFTPVVRSYQFVPADKIQNIEAIRRDIDEAIEVPPPIEGLKRDTIRKN